MDTLYEIELKKVLNNEPTKLIVDYKEESNTFISLVNDGATHKVKFFI